MLELKNVTKCFGDFKALDNLTMTVPRGAVYGLVGPNGAGKSTAIRCLLGVYRPESGEITLNGEEIYENPEIKTTIGSIPDDIFYFPSATLEDMRKYYRGLYPKFDDALFEKLCEVFKLPRKSPIRRFSKGMQKQAAFHLSICTRPDLLVLDEPVDGLDPVMRRQVWSLLLSDVAQRGTTVLISSHNLRELEDICDHVGIMDHGKMLLERSLADMQGATHKLQIVAQLITHNSQLTTRTALFPGTFDPFTIGHAALVRRALSIVDELYIAIGINIGKHTMLTLDERVERIAALYKDEPRIHVVSYEGLTTDFAASVGAQFIIRGVRSSIDFEYERSIADVNRMLTGIDTLLLISEPQYAAISSSMVRELARFGKDIAPYLP